MQATGWPFIAHSKLGFPVCEPSTIASHDVGLRSQASREGSSAVGLMYSRHSARSLWVETGTVDCQGDFEQGEGAREHGLPSWSQGQTVRL